MNRRGSAKDERPQISEGVAEEISMTWIEDVKPISQARGNVYMLILMLHNKLLTYLFMSYLNKHLVSCRHVFLSRN